MKAGALEVLEVLARIPTRKPLAWLAGLLTASVVINYFSTGTDLPENIMELLKWFDTICIGSYAATSTTEAIKGVGASGRTAASESDMGMDQGAASVDLGAASGSPAPGSRIIVVHHKAKS